MLWCVQRVVMRQNPEAPGKFGKYFHGDPLIKRYI
jgi:hypothetical protein